MDLKLDEATQQGTAQKGCAASGCGSNDQQLSHLPEAIREKVFNHPCYSEQAHHYFARMHVAVAPACNIQCNYCNRKYDCANESRPGVVSELLTPQQAVKKTLAVAANIPQMSVLGIAGPGDPLAQPQRTLETFRMLSEQAPDIKLCVSTNGLNLPNVVDELCEHNIDHVTITINCVDPVVGEKIYPWIFWNNRRIRGRKAAEILIAQQQKGLEMLVARGVLVKVNSVMIPGVNDEHLQEVSRLVKAKGAFLHNVMPLIAEEEHGTYYGIMKQRGPTAKELQALQDSCAGDMNMMRHCRQCRADAVGLLGEDRGAEFTIARAGVAAGLMARLDRIELDDARGRIAAEQRALRALQYLDSLYVEQREAFQDHVLLHYVVHDHQHGLRRCEVEVRVAETANIEARRNATVGRLGIEARHAGREGADVVTAHQDRGQIVAAQRGHCDRHFLQVLGTPLSGDDDFVEGTLCRLSDSGDGHDGDRRGERHNRSQADPVPLHRISPDGAGK